MGSHGGSRAGSSGGGGGNSAKIATSGLAELRGTEKQISYANDIRNKYIENFQKQLDDIPDSFDKFTDAEITRKADIGKIEEMIDAPVWKSFDLGQELGSKVRSQHSDDIQNKAFDASEAFDGSYNQIKSKWIKGDLSASRKAMGAEYNKLVKQRKKQAIDNLNDYLKNPNAGSADFWIDNYKRILY